MAWTYILRAIPGDTTSDQQPIWNAGLKNTAWPNALDEAIG